MIPIYVDLFAGGGGASEGIRQAVGRDPDVAINHDRVALAMHEANHPGTWHLRQDIWDVPPRWAARGRPVDLLWASPDCKHFSKAKGSAPNRSREIRSLAWVVEKWGREVRPRVIIMENVEEFKSWGPLDKDGKIIKSQKGTTFTAFLRRLRRLGYAVEYRELRACDYGAPTIRKRLFIIARCDGEPIVWPEPTHGPGLDPYRTAADIIDWSIPCPSIFERKRPLVENTMRRIAEGIRRYVIEAADPFIVTCNHAGGFRGQGMGEPFKTVTASRDAHGLVVPKLSPFITEHANASGQRNFNAAEPLRTQCANVKGGHFALVAPHIQRQFGQGVGQGGAEPVGTITAGGMGKTALVAAFMAQHNTGVVGHGAAEPVSTITHRGTQQNLVASSLVKLRGTCKDGQAVTQPMPTITASGTHVGEVRAFLTQYYGRSIGQRANDPAATVTTKERLGLVTVLVKGEPYIIVDIGMRMLQPRELFRAQGFDDSYQIDVDIDGKPITKTAQVRCCGNSVCPPVAEALVKANVMASGVLPAADQVAV